jgi:hypothetical protein
MEAICESADQREFGWNLGFFDGKEELVSMAKELKQENEFVDNRYIYNGDDILRLQELHDVEICVVEVSGEFLNQDTRKIHFDHHKATFGC